jgi:hypothetical protein
MPYANLPKSLWDKMDRCVRDVKAKNPKVNAYAVCYASITGKGVKAAAKKRGGK